MKYLRLLAAAPIFSVGLTLTATAEPGDQDQAHEEEVAQRLIERRLSERDPGIADQVAAWKAGVLEQMLAIWKRPSEEASSATWTMRVKVDRSGNLLNLSWIARTGNRSLDRSIVNAFKDADPYPAPPDPKAALAGMEFTDEATSIRREEERSALSAVTDAAAIEDIKSAGPLRAYLGLVSHRYKKCESIANTLLSTDSPYFTVKALRPFAFDRIEECAKNEESALAEEVRLALQVAPENLSGQIKSLHAYTVASLRALTNFQQSVIEARQGRADRSTGIDEKATLIGLEL